MSNTDESTNETKVKFNQWSQLYPEFIDLKKQVAIGVPIDQLKTTVRLLSRAQVADLDGIALTTFAKLKLQCNYMDHALHRSSNRCRYVMTTVVDEIYLQHPRPTVKHKNS